MKFHHNKDLSHSLRALNDRAPAPPPARTFWNQFRARAEMVPQNPAAAADYRAPLWPRLALTGVTVLALAVLALTIELPHLVKLQPPLPQLSRIDAVDVFVEHSSVMIMKDEQHGGTLLWITGTEANDYDT